MWVQFDVHDQRIGKDETKQSQRHNLNSRDETVLAFIRGNSMQEVLLNGRQQHCWHVSLMCRQSQRRHNIPGVCVSPKSLPSQQARVCVTNVTISQGAHVSPCRSHCDVHIASEKWYQCDVRSVTEFTVTVTVTEVIVIATVAFVSTVYQLI